MSKITVICREEYHENNILVYVVEVTDLDNENEVQTAVQTERERDLGSEANGMEILFAFSGDLSPCSDWRD